METRKADYLPSNGRINHTFKWGTVGWSDAEIRNRLMDAYAEVKRLRVQAGELIEFVRQRENIEVERDRYREALEVVGGLLPPTLNPPSSQSYHEQRLVQAVTVSREALRPPQDAPGGQEVGPWMS